MSNGIAFAFNPAGGLVWFAHVESIKRAEKNPTKQINRPVSITDRNAIDNILESANMFAEEVEDAADGISLELRIHRLDTDDLVPFEEVKEVLLKAGFSQNEFYTSYVSA